jgi:hypothetical protein
MRHRYVTLLNILIILSVVGSLGVSYALVNNIIQLIPTLKISNTTTSFQGNKLFLSTSLVASNPGPFTAEGSFTALLRFSNNKELSLVSPKISIPSGATDYRAPINLELDLSIISEDDIMDLIQNYSNFTLTASAEVGLVPMLSLRAEVQATIPWAPPGHDLKVGQPAIDWFNSTHIGLNIPYSFENLSSYIDASGSAEASIYDSNDRRIGGGFLNVTAPPNSISIGLAKVVVNLPENTLYLLYHDAKLSYRAEVDFRAEKMGFFVYKYTKSLDVDWGAPVKDPKLIQKQITVFNTTHSLFTATLASTNSNDYITLEGNLRALLILDGETIATGDYQHFQAPPKTTNSWNLELVAPSPALQGGDLILRLELKTKYSDFHWEVPLNG